VTLTQTIVLAEITIRAKGWRDDELKSLREGRLDEARRHRARASVLERLAIDLESHFETVNGSGVACVTA
jgi:hypothetical protein